MHTEWMMTNIREKLVSRELSAPVFNVTETDSLSGGQFTALVKA